MQADSSWLKKKNGKTATTPKRYKSFILQGNENSNVDLIVM